MGHPPIWLIKMILSDLIICGLTLLCQQNHFVGAYNIWATYLMSIKMILLCIIVGHHHNGLQNHFGEALYSVATHYYGQSKWFC